MNRTLLLFGKSTSGGRSRIERIDAATLEPLIDVLGASQERSELRLGHVCLLNEPFLRLVFHAPPEAPIEPQESVNPIVRDANQAQYEAATEEYQRDLEAFLVEKEQWLFRREEEKQNFLAELPRYLSPRDCESSIVEEGMRRLETLASEPVAASEVQTTVLIATDGVDSLQAFRAGTGDFPYLQQSLVVVVSGANDLLSLQQFSPLHLEAMDPAIDYLTAHFRSLELSQ